MNASNSDVPFSTQKQASDRPLLICFSHLRWDFVWQRPQQLLTRAAAAFQVLFVEEPVIADEANSVLSLTRRQQGVVVAVPHVSRHADIEEEQRLLISSMLSLVGSRRRVFWYYTPMALAISEDLDRDVTVYDKMDELSAFLGAPPELRRREDALLAEADVVFTGGKSLWEHTRGRRKDVRLYPSSVDRTHFGKARDVRSALRRTFDPARLTVGFFGVIDERMDARLLEGIARLRPDWTIEMIGPVVKIDPATLPQLPNIRWAGPCPYAELPDRIARWDAGIMPFALNEATRFISPTKTPEFLAAGLPLVSTPIVDVVKGYGEAGLVAVAATATEFVDQIENALRRPRADWLAQVDARLSTDSWDATWQGMRRDIDMVFDRSMDRGANKSWRAETRRTSGGAETPRAPRSIDAAHPNV